MINSKLFYFIPVFLLSIFGCGDVTKPKNGITKGKHFNENDTARIKYLNEIIDNEIASGIRNDTIFLGFHLGMSESEYEQKLKQLINEKKIYVDDISDEYTYDLTARYERVYKCTFSPDYFEGKLFQLNVNPVSTSTSDDMILDNLMLINLFVPKYGIAAIIVNDPNDCKNYVWVNGNRMIMITCSEYSNKNYITYQDAIISKKKNKILLEELDKKLEKSKSDI